MKGKLTLKQIGEFALIKRIAERFKAGKALLRGIGDDAAVVKCSGKKAMILTCDMLIENVHFEISQSSAFQIGWKALGCSISDIAAMGGRPLYALLSLGLPKNLGLDFVDGIYRGISKLARKFKINIIGGDTNSAPCLVIDLFLIGEGEAGKIVYRDGAKKNDFIGVTGTLGNSRISGRHLKFTPRLKEAQFLTRNFKINSMLDLSDGLSSDLPHILEQSDKGALIFEEHIPLSRGASFRQALNEGEDFELLFTLSEKEALRLIRKSRELDCPVSFIGTVLDKPKKLLLFDRAGSIVELKPQGFRHFQ